MDKNRLWIIGSVLLIVAVMALGWVLGIQPQLTIAAGAEVNRVKVLAENAEHEVVLARLKEDFLGIDKLNEEYSSLAMSVPSGTNTPDYVDQLDALARAHHVTLRSLTVADALAYTPVAPVAPPAPAPASSDAPSTPAPTATPAPVAVPGSPPVTNARITAENFASLSVQITVSGTYNNVLDFVNGLQTGQRLFLVTGLATKAVEKADTTAGDLAETTDGEPADTTDVVGGIISGLIYSIVTPETALEVGAG